MREQTHTEMMGMIWSGFSLLSHKIKKESDLREVPQSAGAPENRLHTGPMGRCEEARTAPDLLWRTADVACKYLAVHSEGEKQKTR